MSKAFKNTSVILLIVLGLLFAFTSFASRSVPKVAPQGPAQWRVFDQHAPEAALQIARGNFIDTTTINVFGRNDDIDTGVAEDLWEIGGLYVFPIAAETVTVVSDDAADTSAGTGARTLAILGLDVNFDEVQDVVTLNGLTPVVSTQTFIRVTTAVVQTAGSALSNVGVISATQTITVAVNLFSMQPDTGRTDIGVYTVPRSHTFLLINVFGSVLGATGIGTVATVSLRFRDASIIDSPFLQFSGVNLAAQGNSWVTVDFGAPNIIEEMTDIVMRGGSSSNSTGINGGFTGYLIDNR